jgi:hypothetical protein
MIYGLYTFSLRFLSMQKPCPLRQQAFQTDPPQGFPANHTGIRKMSTSLKLQADSMNIYEFTFVIETQAGLDDGLEDALYEAGCDDATLSFRKGIAYLNFDREAEDLELAIITAIQQTEQIGLTCFSHVEERSHAKNVALFLILFCILLSIRFCNIYPGVQKHSSWKKRIFRSDRPCIFWNLI